jgi:hypothetical protein
LIRREWVSLYIPFIPSKAPGGAVTQTLHNFKGLAPLGGVPYERIQEIMPE